MWSLRQILWSLVFSRSILIWLSFRRQHSGFLIIGLPYYAQDFRGFLYYTATTSSAGNAEYDYYSVDLRALPIVLHILISINSTLVPFVFNLPLNEIARTQFFVRWMDCNTPFPEYVLSCVFRFSIVFFSIYFLYLFCIMNSLYDCFVLDLDSWTRSQP